MPRLTSRGKIIVRAKLSSPRNRTTFRGTTSPRPLTYRGSKSSPRGHKKKSSPPRRSSKTHRSSHKYRGGGDRTYRATLSEGEVETLTTQVMKLITSNTTLEESNKAKMIQLMTKYETDIQKLNSELAQHKKIMEEGMLAYKRKFFSYFQGGESKELMEKFKTQVKTQIENSNELLIILDAATNMADTINDIREQVRKVVVPLIEQNQELTAEQRERFLSKYRPNETGIGMINPVSEIFGTIDSSDKKLEDAIFEGIKALEGKVVIEIQTAVNEIAKKMKAAVNDEVAVPELEEASQESADR